MYQLIEQTRQTVDDEQLRHPDEQETQSKPNKYVEFGHDE
jgi:hypothetical protein